MAPQRVICRMEKLVAISILALGVAGCSDDSRAPDSSSSQPSSAPHAESRLTPIPNKAQLDRKQRSMERLVARGLTVPDDLPVLPSAEAIEGRSADGVAERCLAVLICAIRGAKRAKDEELIAELTEYFGAASYFSPVERRFLDEAQPSRQALIDASWGYEQVHVFLWALGYLDQLESPSAVANVAAESKILAEHAETFVADAELRPYREILDEADFYFRLRWAAREMRSNNLSSSEINESVVRERLRALRWLIDAQKQAWDETTGNL